MEPKRDYRCIFNEKKRCSVKNEFKLKPESLVEFCKVCSVNSIIMDNESNDKSGKRSEEFEVVMLMTKHMFKTQQELSDCKAKLELMEKQTKS